MPQAPLIMTLLPGFYSVCRLDPAKSVPAWATQGEFFSITCTRDEVSVVVSREHVPEGVVQDSGWRCFRVEGPLPLTAIGVLATLTAALSKASVSVFAVSTHDTDYLLVKEEAVEIAAKALAKAGHAVKREAATKS
jgi:hypothetical protein